MMVFPNRCNGIGRRFAGADREYDGGQSSCDELVNGKGGKAVEKMGIVDTDDDPAIAGVADESVDDLADASKGIGAEVAGDVGEGAQGDAARRCGADDPMAARVSGAADSDRFGRQPGFADTGRAR
jgi:hypothetical protein